MGYDEPIDIRLLADDLTGALDSAVAFASAGSGVAVTWWPHRHAGARAAIDLATREGGEAEAARRHAEFAPWLSAGRICFKKIDSVLRGHPVAEIAACIEAGGFERVIVAPAFPFQGRVTRAGRQWRLDREEQVGPPLGRDLARRFAVAHGRPGDAPRRRVTVYDAETQHDLDDIVSAVGVRSASTLWVGSGGLAAALARHLDWTDGAAVACRGPFLALVGTDNEVTRRQVRHFAERDAQAEIVIGGDVAAARARLVERMARGAPSLVTVAANGDRRAAARRVERAFAELLDGLPKPGTLLVTGGETLRSVCETLGSARLVVEKAIEPGLPVSRMGGGRFDGVVTISKSGGFGEPGLFSRLAGAMPA